MLKYFMIFSLLFTCACSTAPRRISSAAVFRIVNYNIRELDCVKLSAAEKNLESQPQIKAALEIIEMLKPDILSINEMQYDRYKQPSTLCTTPQGKLGLNVQRFARLLGWAAASTFMGDANTGQNAIKMANGKFSTDPAAGGAFADPINFGLFPGQYSVGLISKFPGQTVFFTRELLWKDFNLNIDLTAYRYIDKRENTEGTKKAIDKNTYELFDKNFTDTIIMINERPVHVVQLHTVVGGAFGNEMSEAESPNSARNADELAFLEWYVTGETVLNGQKFNAPKIVSTLADGSTKEIYPLAQNTVFVAIGDWNIEADAAPQKLGSIVLKRLFSKARRWYVPTQYTQETWNFKPTTRPGQLDYMVVSNNLEVVGSGGYYPDPQKKNLGCNITKPKASAGKVVGEYKTATQTCFVEVSAAYYKAKTASDHFPIWAELKFKN